MPDNHQPYTPDHVKLGFIGLGLMGQRIAARLIDHGYHLTVFNRTREKAAPLVSRGAVAASSVDHLARESDVILSCLADDEAVLAVYTSSAGAIAQSHPGTTIIEMSTVCPETSRELYRIGAEHQVSVLDVPISGSTPAAEQGTLTLLAGGDRDRFQASEPIFRTFARQWFHLGLSGSGTTMKLVVNTLLGVGIEAIAEAVTLGEKSGLDRSRMLDVLSRTDVVAPAHLGKLEKAEHRDYRPQFPLRNMNKDFHLILERAAQALVPMPATAAAYQVNLSEAAAAPEEDFSAVIRTMEQLAALERALAPA